MAKSKEQKEWTWKHKAGTAQLKGSQKIINNNNTVICQTSATYAPILEKVPDMLYACEIAAGLCYCIINAEEDGFDRSDFILQQAKEVMAAIPEISE